MYAGTADAALFVGVYRSTDRGESWRVSSQGLPDQNYGSVLRDALTVDHVDPVGLYFGTTSGQLFRSRNEDETWAHVPGQYPRIFTVKAAGVA